MASDIIARALAAKCLNGLSSISALKNNLNATSTPTSSDDISSGYAVGSVWIYSGTTYTCADATAGNAIWTSSVDEIYFDDWSALITAISVIGSDLVGKYAHVANANGAPSSGLTYTAPDALTDYIVDGGSAILEVLAQGTNYSVRCLTRTVTNPVVTSVMLTSTTKPTVKGYYIFSVTPSDGLPTGIGLNDIAYFDGNTWSVYQKYSVASAVLVAGTTTNTQVTWRKFNGRWMSTADDFIPDKAEYQTGKLWNGKPVYRRCCSGALGTSGVALDTGMNKPTAGTMLMAFCSVNYMGTRWLTFNSRGDADAYIDETGNLKISTTNASFISRPYIAWMEYTKT